MGVVLIGTVDSSYRVLETLIDLHVPIDAVLSLPPGAATGVSDFADLGLLAVQHGIHHRYIEQVNAPEIVAFLRSVHPDVIFVIGWSQIIKTEIIHIPRYGCIGAHPALLPRNRGRAVIPWAIIQGESATGMTLFHIDEGTDSGDIIAQTVLPITDEDTAQTLYGRAVDALCSMLRTHMRALLEGAAPRLAQDHARASYCAKRTPEDGLIDWRASSRAIYNLVRAVTRPYPGAFSYFGATRVTVWAAALADEDWVGVPGQIVRLDAQYGALVKTGDGTVWLKEIEADGHIKPVSSVFKRVGVRLGTPDASTLLRRIEQLEAKLNQRKEQ